MHVSSNTIIIVAALATPLATFWSKFKVQAMIQSNSTYRRTPYVDNWHFTLHRSIEELHAFLKCKIV